MMTGMGGGPAERQSFLFNTEMANEAAQDLQQRQVADFTQWHLMHVTEWHIRNPSTSNGFSFKIRYYFKFLAFFEQQRQMQLLQQQQQPPTSTSRSPQAPASRATKRKASNRAITVFH